MRRTPFILLLCLSATLASCGTGLGFRSRERQLAVDYADTIDSNYVEFQGQLAGVLADPPVCRALAAELCDRILEIDAVRREIESRGAAAEREQQSQRAIRYREILIQLGAPAAGLFVEMCAGAGYGVSVALDALARMPDKIVEPAVIEAFQSGNPAVRRGALRAAAATESRIVRFQDVAAELLKDPEAAVRRDACALLGRGKLAGARYDDALASALDDPDPTVASEAARALGRRHAMVKIDGLIEYLDRVRTAMDPLAVEAALQSLQEITNRRDIGPDPADWRRWLEQNRPAAKPSGG